MGDISLVQITFPSAVGQDATGCAKLSANPMPVRYTVQRSVNEERWLDCASIENQKCDATSSRMDMVPGWKGATRFIKIHFEGAESCRVGCTQGNFIAVSAVQVLALPSKVMTEEVVKAYSYMENRETKGSFQAMKTALQLEQGSQPHTLNNIPKTTTDQ